jgi:hypothetical protein
MFSGAIAASDLFSEPVSGVKISRGKMTALTSAMTTAAAGVVATRTTNRITLIKAALNQASVPPTTSVGELAASFSEVRAAAAFLAGASSLDSQLAVLRVRIRPGPH